MPHRKPLNFTFEGLHQAQQSIDRLRNFRYRLTQGNLSPRAKVPRFRTARKRPGKNFEAALDDNLNTAEALGAIFDMVREGNTAMDRGRIPRRDRGAFLDTLERWDRIFAVLGDDDHAKLVKFGFVREGAGALKPGADVKPPKARDSTVKRRRSARRRRWWRKP